VVGLAAVLSISPTYAQRAKWYPEKQNFGAFVERLNANTITIVSGDRDGVDPTIANDLSAVLDDGEDFRVLPLMGRGGAQNIRDVRFLKGVDLAVTQAPLLNALRRSNEIGTLDGKDGKIVYVARLFNEEVHVVVRADSGLTSIAELAGKKVNFGEVGGSTDLLARDLFGRLAVKAEAVNGGQAVALARLKAGEIAASVLVAGKPSAALARLAADDGLRLIPVPLGKELQDDYLPALLTDADYPAMVPAGDGVQTVSVGTVLIAYNWPRGSEPYRRLEDFVGRFFAKLADLRTAPRHPKWREANFAAVLPGWTRFAPAEDWLTRNREVANSRNAFEEFLASRQGRAPTGETPEERERLFSDFVKWTAARERR
jgi:TRAP transporter TAXI family solute receptor